MEAVIDLLNRSGHNRLNRLIDLIVQSLPAGGGGGAGAAVGRVVGAHVGDARVGGRDEHVPAVAGDHVPAPGRARARRDRDRPQAP